MRQIIAQNIGLNFRAPQNLAIAICDVGNICEMQLLHTSPAIGRYPMKS